MDKIASLKNFVKIELKKIFFFKLFLRLNNIMNPFSRSMPRSYSINECEKPC